MVTSQFDRLTDYCTAFPDELFGVSMRFCCFTHDMAYAATADKITADLELALCVSKGGLGWVSLLMLAGVTCFGWIFYPRKRR